MVYKMFYECFSVRFSCVSQNTVEVNKTFGLKLNGKAFENENGGAKVELVPMWGAGLMTRRR